MMIQRIWKRVKVWCKANNQFVALAGLLVVFVSFVIKDGIKDHLKDITSAMDNAQSMYQIQIQQAQTLSALTRLEEAILQPSSNEFQRFYGDNALNAAYNFRLCG